MGKPVIPIAYQFTAAQITAGDANNLPKGTSIIVIDANGQPTDVKVAQGGGQAPIEAAGLKNNFAATTFPLATDDSGDGYAIGSRWVDTTGDESYICLDATLNNAVWSKTTVGIISEVAGLQTALDAKAPLASPAFTGTPTGITKTHVGLGNADNTADTDKPVSTAQQTALNLKQDASTAATDAELSAHTGNVSNPHVVTKSQVGLGSVDNTADTSKPVSTATQTALDGKSATSHTHAGTYEPADATILKEAEVVNTLVGTATNLPLSAAQGKVLQDGKQELYEGTVALRTPSNLTSNTSDPNYILTASSEHTIHLFYRVFDGNDANHWYTLGTPVANGVIELRYKIRPTNLLLRGETTILEYWTRWQLQGSNNGTTWETLIDKSGADEVIQNTSKNFPITTSKEYKYFRFNGLAAIGTNIPLSRLEISGVESERNFIDWTSYTPVVTSETGTWTNYTATGRYRIVDKMLTVSFRVAFTGATAAADAMYVSIPSGLTMNASVMTGGASWDTDLVGFGILGDSGTISGVPALITTKSTQRVLVKYYNAAAIAYLTCPGLSNTAPWSWTTSDTVDGQFTVPIL